MAGSDDLPSSSPFPNSPFSVKKTSSPRAFWLGKDSENATPRSDSPGIGRRSSLEKLKRASRVQNNTKIFDKSDGVPPPRPLTYHGSQSTALPATSSASFVRGSIERTKLSIVAAKRPDPPPKDELKKLEREDSPPKLVARPTSILSSPTKMSPTKPSLVSFRSDSREGDSVYSESEDGISRSPTKRPKSVTFDKEPPHVLQYEMVTPDPSVEGSPAMTYDSDEEEDEDEDELENQPVIEPDGEWSRMLAREAAAHNELDEFRTTPSPTSRPLPPIPGARQESPSGARPLPTIPLTKADLQNQQQMPLEDRVRLMMDSGEDEQSHVGRFSREGSLTRESEVADGLGISLGNLSISEEPEDLDEHASSDLLQDGVTAGRNQHSINSNKENDGESLSSHYESASEYEAPPPRLSRESIRRQVEERRQQDSTSYEFHNDAFSRRDQTFSYGEQTGYQDEGVKIKGEEHSDDGTVDLYTVSEVYNIPERPASRFDTRSPDMELTTDSEASHYDNDNDDDESRYSEPPPEDEMSRSPDPGDVTPTPQSPALTPVKDMQDAEDSKKVGGQAALPDLSSVFADDDGLGLKNYMTPSPPLRSAELVKETVHEPMKAPTKQSSKQSIQDPPKLEAPSTLTARDFFARAETPEEKPTAKNEEEIDNYEDEDTGSVIRHKIYYSDEEEEAMEMESMYDQDREAEIRLEQRPEHRLSHVSEYEDEDDQDTEREGSEVASVVTVTTTGSNRSRQDVRQDEPNRSPSPVEEAVATIRAPGGVLKTRASATPADMRSMAAARRHVSGERKPRIFNGYRSEGDNVDGSSDEDSGPEYDILSDTEKGQKKPVLKKKPSLLPTLGEFEFDLKLDDLSEEFDRVIEAQKAYYSNQSSPERYYSNLDKRGYLMRQNTRIIHASSHEPDETPTVPAQRGHARNQSWSVEPWRSGQRRRSQRDMAAGVLRKKPSLTGPVPPLPGQEGVTSKRLPSVEEVEIESRASTQIERDDHGERGRLFVKVVGVKDLQLPLPSDQPTYFCLTLDNGLHCVTTSWLELGKNAPIGQEFELVVLNDLEFQLTLQTKLEQPPPQPPRTATKPPTQKTKSKQSTFSRVFTSNKKRKALEQQQQLEEEKKRETPPPQTAWDMLHGLVARDGSFARSYVCLKDFESRAYGRPFTTDINCFNEWAVDTASVKSKKGLQGGLQPARKAPYKIGKLEVQLLFVPKPKTSSEKELPKSMNAAIRELREAEATMNQHHEGNLSQQGGDCPYWRRRYFKLDGPRLTAYHEATRQPRATINLSKAVKLIDDRNTLVDPTVNGPGKSRRKSGFSEEEEGYMFVEEGFRIRFANGEVIDFYADSAEDKTGWMKVLSETIGRLPEQRGWCDLVLAREAKQRTDSERTVASNPKLRSLQMQAKQQQQLPLPPAQPAPPPKSIRRPISQA
ncbi:Bud site selection protein bud4 [Rhizina undulata]